MKNLLSKGAITKIALLMLLLLNAFAGMTILVNAAKPTKENNVFIGDNGSVKLTWKSGKSKTYSSTTYAKLTGLDDIAIIPNHGYHIAEPLLIDDLEQVIVDEDGFNFATVKNIDTISVVFEDNGGVDDVDEGLGAEAYPDPGVGLIFVNVLGEGWAYADTIELQEPSPIEDFWNIYTELVVFEPGVKVMLVLNLEYILWVIDNPEQLRLLKTEYYLARSDVNWNDVVDGDDVSDVGNANPSAEDDPDWDPRYDINDDHVVDDLDVNIVNNYQGMSVWVDITTEVFVDEVNGLVYVYGETDDLSIFGTRRTG